MTRSDPSPARTGPAPAAADGPVAVWDLPLRLFHWALVLLVVTLGATGLVKDDALRWHMRAGQALIALLLFRVAWGFAGSRHARFVSFVRGPAAVLRYARSLVVPPHEVHATHNPLGGWMVIAMLAALAVQATTGLFTNDDVLWEGPLAARVARDVSDAMSSIHRRGWWVVVALVVAHVAAVAVYRWVFKEDLVRPMIDGVKPLPPGAADPADAAASGTRAAVVLALCALAVIVLPRI